jgi:hypothetical protein
LQGCAGAFRAERMRVWQLVFSKGGIPGGYAYSGRHPKIERSIGMSAEARLKELE